MAHGDDSEAWRGEEAKPHAGFFLVGPELTDEQREEIKARIAQRRAEAAMRSLVLPSLNASATCIKCGGTKVSMRYCPGGTADRQVAYACFLDTNGHEHMHRECKRCGFEWYEKTLDAAGIA